MQSLHFCNLNLKTILSSSYLFIRATAFDLTTDASFTATKFKIIIIPIPFNFVILLSFTGAKLLPCSRTDKFQRQNVYEFTIFLTHIKKG